MWARGLKHTVELGNVEAIVAPHVGAWIETAVLGTFAEFALSRPMWARGLKLNLWFAELEEHPVAPHVGAWIETVLYPTNTHMMLSRPMWARGLKHFISC